jgi:hypothetical protein
VGGVYLKSIQKCKNWSKALAQFRVVNYHTDNLTKFVGFASSAAVSASMDLICFNN